MKKKIFVILGILFAILLTLASLIFLFLNRMEKVEGRNGKYFDDSGNQLGSCNIESKLRYLADMPTYTTYYYDLNKKYLGYCKGDGIGCTVSLKKEPKICEPFGFQKSCDKSVHPVGFGATAKYICVLE